jgi:hypothetical protein
MWSFTITNGNAETSDLTAYAIVGAAEFRDMDYFEKFLVVQRPNPPGKYDLPFDIRVSLVLFTNPEGSSERRVGFSRHQLVMSTATDSDQSDSSRSAIGSTVRQSF